MPAILHLNLHREWFAAIVAITKRTECRRRPPSWKTRLENRQYDVVQFRNGDATDAPEMPAEFLGVRRIKKYGQNVYAIRLGKILKIKRWKH